MSVLILPSDSSQGEPFLLKDARATTPGTEQTLITQVLAFDVKLKTAQVTCNMEGKFRVLHDGVLIGAGRTGPGDRNPIHFWLPNRQIMNTELLELKFTAFNQTAIVTVESFLSTAKD